MTGHSRALCFCSLFLFLILAPVSLFIPWSLDRLGSSSDPILWSVSSLSRHRMSVARPWNVCRACSAAVCRAQGAAQAQPWPAADPGPGSDQSVIADNEEYQWPVSVPLVFKWPGTSRRTLVSSFVCAQSHSPLSLLLKPAPLDQIYYHRLSWTYFGWLLCSYVEGQTVLAGPCECWRAE